MSVREDMKLERKNNAQEEDRTKVNNCGEMNVERSKSQSQVTASSIAWVCPRGVCMNEPPGKGNPREKKNSTIQVSERKKNLLKICD